MQIYIDDDGVDFTKENLDEIGHSYIHMKVFERLNFQEPKLDYVLGVLAEQVEFMPNDKAEELVKRLILYLKGKEYERI